MAKIDYLLMYKMGLKMSDIDFIIKLKKKELDITNMSYYKIGEQIGMSYESVRYHFKALKKAGCLEIERISQTKLIFHLNTNLLNELINE